MQSSKRRLKAYTTYRESGFSGTGCMLHCGPSLWTPKRSFGRSNQHFRMRFRSTFQGCEDRIWATSRWKVLRTRILKSWFGLPKLCLGALSKNSPMPRTRRLRRCVWESQDVSMCRIACYRLLYHLERFTQKNASHIACYLLWSSASKKPICSTNEGRTNISECLFEVYAP